MSARSDSVTTRARSSTNQSLSRLVALSNSTSPAHDQIAGLNAWTREDVDLVLSHTGHPPHPCPTALFQEMITITRLRVAVYKAPQAVDALSSAARAASRNIQAFDPDSWNERYDSTGELYSLFGKLFQAAMMLYGIVSLPSSLSSAFHQAAGNNLALDEASSVSRQILCDKKADEARLFYRDRLFRLITEARPIVPMKRALCWTSGVLGVAAYDSPAIQRTIREFLVESRVQRWSNGGGTALLEKLNEFWASGATRWDACFFEPISVY